VDGLYNSLYNTKSGKKFYSWYKHKNQAKLERQKVMPRPSSVMTYKRNMDASKDLRRMRKFAREKQERCIKDMSTFEHYVKGKLVRKE